MSEFLRVVKTTISDYLHDEEINIMKNQKFSAMLQDKQRISYDHSGLSLNWPVRSARNGLLPYTDAATQTFNRVNRDQRADLPWRGYTIPEAITKKERLMNRGKEALVNYASKLGEFMKDDFKFYFNAELYIDGTTTANADRIHGIQSCLGNNGAAQYPTPNSTYAGLVTNLGNYAGSALNGSTWPVGQFDPAYYFWSPLILSYNNSGWNASTNNWANNCLEVLRYGQLLQLNLKGTQGKMDMVVMEATMFAQFQDAYAAKERVVVNRGGEAPGLVKLGFNDVLNFNGVDVTSEADCPSNQAFGIAFDSLELCSMQKQLFDLEDMDDINTLSEKFVASFFGNLKMNPRGLVNWINAG